MTIGWMDGGREGGSLYAHIYPLLLFEGYLIPLRSIIDNIYFINRACHGLGLL